MNKVLERRQETGGQTWGRELGVGRRKKRGWVKGLKIVKIVTYMYQFPKANITVAY